MSRRGDAAGRVHRAYVWGRDGQIHYRRSGPEGARSPLLLLHAAESSGAPFEAFMSEMGRERSVIAPDRPGAGMSDPLRDGGDAAAQAMAMLEIVAELGLGMVDVIGIKDGGVIAVEMARQQPEVVRKIILVATPAPDAALSQPTLALAHPGFPDGAEGKTADTIRSFLDT
jgi:pimeloyl-ACP methyl ester carboxylesterase